jgi:hypothetical protein
MTHVFFEGLSSMRRRCQLVVGGSRVLGFGFVFLIASQLRADSVQNIGLYDGANAPIVEIQYTGNSGVWVYGDAQTAANWTYPNGAYVPLYCIDLQHDNYLGSSYQLTAWTDPNSFSCDAINRVAWAIDNTTLTGYGPAATQLLVWSIIDPNFEVINWNGNTGPGSVQAAYDDLDARMIAEYNPLVNYVAGVSFFDAVHQPASYMNQDLAVGNYSAQFSVQSVPEPASAVSASIGVVSLVLLVWLRKLRRRSCCPARG